MFSILGTSRVLVVYPACNALIRDRPGVQQMWYVGLLRWAIPMAMARLSGLKVAEPLPGAHTRKPYGLCLQSPSYDCGGGPDFPCSAYSSMPHATQKPQYPKYNQWSGTTRRVNHRPLRAVKKR